MYFDELTLGHEFDIPPAVIDKQQMIDFIKANPNCTKTKYFKNGRWVVGEDVRVVDNRYLRTDSNYIKADNLENLPEY